MFIVYNLLFFGYELFERFEVFEGLAYLDPTKSDDFKLWMK